MDTNKQDLLTKLQDLNRMVLEGQAMEAFEKYYADDVIMQENESAATVGKTANREREIQFFGALTEFRGAQVLAVGVGDGKTFSEWFYDYTHKDWGVRRYKQVAVQTWKDGKIVHEKFYYGT